MNSSATIFRMMFFCRNALMLVFCGCRPMYFSMSADVIRPFFSVITCSTSSANSFRSRTLASSSSRLDRGFMSATIIWLIFRIGGGDECTASRDDDRRVLDLLRLLDPPQPILSCLSINANAQFRDFFSESRRCFMCVQRILSVNFECHKIDRYDNSHMILWSETRKKENRTGKAERSHLQGQSQMTHCHWGTTFPFGGKCRKRTSKHVQNVLEVDNSKRLYRRAFNVPLCNWSHCGSDKQKVGCIDGYSQREFFSRQQREQSHNIAMHFLRHGSMHFFNWRFAIFRLFERS